MSFINGEPRKLKRVPIKEELVAIAGDFIKAIILQQFIYWSERTRDYDKFIAEERERAELRDEEFSAKPLNGWMYKSAEELSEETMLGYKATAMRDHIKVLVAKGYLSERNNPLDRRDRTIQYRVNLLAIQLDLFEKGYPLEGYKNPFSMEILLKVIHRKNDSRIPGMQHSLSENAISESVNAQPCAFEGLGTEKAISESVNAISEYGVANHEIIEALPETTTESNYLNIINTWKLIVDNLQQAMSSQSFCSWIKPIHPEIQGVSLILTCPNEFALNWVTSRYVDLLIKAVPTNTGLNEIILQLENGVSREVFELKRKD